MSEEGGRTQKTSLIRLNFHLIESYVNMHVDREKFFIFSMQHNLGEIVNFHGLLRGSLKELYQASLNDNPTTSRLENYDEYLSASTFLIAYSYLEEYLYLIWKFKAKEEDRGKGYSIRRYKPILKALGVKPTNSSWQNLLKATRIRDCLLHANGRLSFMKDNDEQTIRQLVREFQPALQIQQGDRLKLEVQFLSRFISWVCEFQDEIHVVT